jgi:hypothetical protein
MRRYVSFLSCAFALVLVVSACGGSGKNHAKTSGGSTASSSGSVAPAKPTGPIAPLTGSVDASGASVKRCVVTVKIDNTQVAQPHYGLEQADVIYEEVVEGHITRLAAMFNSKAPDRVGPVRSVRKTDQSLVWPVGGVFAYSGGAQYAIDSINTAPVVQLDETRAGSMMFRDHSREAPHNLYAHVDQMYARCGPKIPPPALFAYRVPGTPIGGTLAGAVHVGFLNGYAVTWTWNRNTKVYERTLFGRPEIAASGARLAPRNVVVMFTNYVGGNAEGLGAEATLTGTGKLLVFTGGREITGTWSRPDKSKPAKLLDAGGNEIRLGPGQTWVELPDASYTVTASP